MSNSSTFSRVESSPGKVEVIERSDMGISHPARQHGLPFILITNTGEREHLPPHTLNWTKWWWTRYISLHPITKLPPSLSLFHPLKSTVFGEKNLNNNNEQTWFMYVLVGNFVQQIRYGGKDPSSLRLAYPFLLLWRALLLGQYLHQPYTTSLTWRREIYH